MQWIMDWVSIHITERRENLRFSCRIKEEKLSLCLGRSCVGVCECGIMSGSAFGVRVLYKCMCVEGGGLERVCVCWGGRC